MYFQNQHTLDGMEKALPLFRQAIQMGPELSTAHLGIGQTLYLYVVAAGKPELVNEGVSAAKKAIELDPDNANCHWVLGGMCGARGYMSDGDYSEGISVLEHALTIDSNSVQIHHQLGRFLVWAGNVELGLEHLETALRLSPRDIAVVQIIGAMTQAHFALGNYEQVIEWTTKAQRAQRNLLWPALAAWIAALAHLGRLEEARNQFDEVKKVYPNLASLVSNQPVGFRDDMVNGFRKAGIVEE